LAFTPPGAPATWILGLGDGLGVDGVAGGWGLAVEARMAAGCGLSPPAGAQAVTPAAMTATTVSQTIRILLPSH
jgi:hypothetical protein